MTSCCCASDLQFLLTGQNLRECRIVLGDEWYTMQFDKVCIDMQMSTFLGLKDTGAVKEAEVH